ncbi:PEP/pyruvate-binding domain-containing protein [Loktanella sp. R86503]|uniref:PEP/pyruvate-binding domain-containing protein n=1 Tax=Loktanella sp. R86503 TaxID=3093847 RepID=UPI0036D8A7B5
MSGIIAQEAAQDAQQVGGKAASLAQLAKLGFNPPTFFVIPASACAGSEPITGLTAALRSLGTGPFAVRSSAKSEDGAEHSHAGQFDTVLNVAAADVWQAAQQVYQSGFGDTVATYRQLKSGGGGRRARRHCPTHD